MFSSNDLVHIVFENENDTYYNCGLMKPDLNEHLWFELHSQYSCVYFLSPENGGCVKTFGELCAKQYEGDTSGRFALKLTSKKNHDPLGMWMLKQMTAKQSEAAAFICSLADFCSMFGSETHREALSAMAVAEKRTGIIVLTVPATVEKSRRLLLESPVFEYLNDKPIMAVRTGNLREMYSSVFKNKIYGCHFLNVITEKDALGLLTCIEIDNVHQCPPHSVLRSAAKYLSQYVINQELQAADAVLKHLRQGTTRRELYEQLKDERVRNKLYEKAAEMQSVGGMHEYLKKTGCEYVSSNSPAARICRSPDSLAGKCLALNSGNTADIPEPCKAAVCRIVSELKTEAIKPKNHLENEKISEKALQFLRDAEDALACKDFETYRRALNAVRICTNWLYAAHGSQEEQNAQQLMDKLGTMIHLSENCFINLRNLEINRKIMVSGELGELAVTKLESKAMADQKVLLKYEDMVFAKMMSLSVQQLSDVSIYESMEELNDMLDDMTDEMKNSDYTDSPAQTADKAKTEYASVCEEESPAPVPDNCGGADDSDIIYEFEPSDFGYIPPKLHR